MKSISLEVVTQEKPVYSGEVEAISAPASEGEVTILPDHIPLFTKLTAGELRLLSRGRWQILAVAGGFMDVAPKGVVTILADSATRIEEINVAKAEAAKSSAQQKLKQQKLSEHDFARISSDLRRAVLELDIARKHRRRTQLPSE